MSAAKKPGSPRFDDTVLRDLPEPQRISASPHGMVATQHWEATAAGVAQLAAGGNAIDAAVAAAFALGVCEPAASGIGGQTMMVVRLADGGRTVALDGSSRAPNRAAPDALGEDERLRGYRAATVPSTPATLDYALRSWGSRTLADVLAPSIALAEHGIVVTELLHRLMRRARGALRKRSGGAFFLKDGKRSWPAGSVLHQPVLARTLERLAEHGIEDFYRGSIAAEIAADMEANGGFIRADDLAQIPVPIERKPIAGHLGKLRLLTMPPPGAGRTLIEVCNVVNNLPTLGRDLDTPDGVVMLAEIIRRAQADRQDRPYDPALYAQIDDERMVSPEYAAKVAKKISKRIAARRPRGETTHLSVMDAAGNVVALTQSIERVFGSCEVTPSLGFLYNDYLSAFAYGDITHPFAMRPNAAPWASVAPTIVMKGRKPWCAIGSPGSDRIVSAILQVLLRLQYQGAYDAVAAPRMHCALDGTVSIEAPRWRDDIPQALRRHGFTVDAREAWSFYLGCVQLVLRDGKTFIGVADPRRDGSAGGPPTPPA